MSKRALALAVVAGAAVGLGVPASAVAAPQEPSKIVYMTFDDGPEWANDSRLLPLLRRQRVPATFFLVGSRLVSNPSLATRLWMSGHAVGNHTYSHSDLTTLDGSGVLHQLSSAQRLLGRSGGGCMRPPYGAVNATTYAASRQLGLKPVLWDVDPQDWAHQNTSYIVNHVLTHVRHRSVVLLHDGGGSRAATVAAVRELIPRLRERGYEFRTVPACRVPLRGRVDGVARRIVKKPAKPVVPVVPTPQPTASAPGVTQ